MGNNFLCYSLFILSLKKVLDLSTISENGLKNKKAPFVRCECGFEILLLPDLKMIVKAIETHGVQHGVREKDAAKAASEQQRIENDLSANTLKATASFTEK